MDDWTPDEVRRVLDRRDRAELNRLARDLTDFATKGRRVLRRARPWLSAVIADASELDDLHDVVEALFADSARLLRRFGDIPDFRGTPDALLKYVIGITFNVLLRKHQKRVINWEELREDLTVPGEPALDFVRLAQALDLERALAALKPELRRLFAMIYVRRLAPATICDLEGIALNAFEARKSRLLKRLRALLEDDE